MMATLPKVNLSNLLQGLLDLPAQILRHRPPFADTLPFCGCSPGGETLFLLRHSAREIAELEYALV